VSQGDQQDFAHKADVNYSNNRAAAVALAKPSSSLPSEYRHWRLVRDFLVPSAMLSQAGQQSPIG
jgi:hypothetical protein